MAVFSNSITTLAHYPDKNELREIIGNLSDDTDSFIIAENGNQFIQSSKNNGKYILQYNDGTKLFQCQSNELTIDQLTDLFHAFNVNFNNWQLNLKWDEQELKSTFVPTNFYNFIIWLGFKRAVLSLVILILIFLFAYYFGESIIMMKLSTLFSK